MERKNEMLKKISALIIALTMCAAMLSGCNNSSSGDADSGSSDVSSSAETSSGADGSSPDSAVVPPQQQNTVAEPSLTIDGKKMDINNFTMLTINGVDVDFLTFRYFYFYTVNQFTQNYGATLDTLKSVQGGFEDLIKQTVNNIKNSRMVVDVFAKDGNITLNDDDKKAIEENYKQTKSQFSSDTEFLNQLKNAYLTEDILRKNIEYSQLTNKISTTLFTNEGKYATKKADFRNIAKDSSKFACEMHIMIPYFSEVELDAETMKNYDTMTLESKLAAKQTAYTALDDAGREKAKNAAKAKADEALKKAAAGEDFAGLIKTYGWDTALAANPEGYYFSKDNSEFPTELVSKTFTLKENEVAKDLINNDTYGYFIVKRCNINMDYVEKNIDNMIAQYDQPRIDKLIKEKADGLTVKYCDGWDKLTIDSIT